MTSAGRNGALLVVAAASMISILPAAAAESYANWDTFDGATQLDAKRWVGMERTRQIESGAMRVIQRDLGNQSGNGGVLNSSWDSNLANPAAITQMRAAMTVDDFDVAPCGANPTPSTVESRLVGLYFNAGPGLPTSVINDVGAKIRLVRYSNSADAAGVLRIEGVVFQCTVADCNSNDIVLGSTDLGTATLGETVTLKMEWEPANNRFNFYRGSDPVKRVKYTANDSQAPYYPFRGVGTRTSLANCLSGNRAEGFISAKFDKVSVNKSATP